MKLPLLKINKRIYDCDFTKQTVELTEQILAEQEKLQSSDLITLLKNLFGPY